MLNTQPFPEQADFIGGSGSTRLLFAYRVQRGDRATMLDLASGAGLQLNGTTITAVGTGADTRC